jgi:hypothetical protein
MNSASSNGSCSASNSAMNSASSNGSCSASNSASGRATVVNDSVCFNRSISTPRMREPCKLFNGRVHCRD